MNRRNFVKSILPVGLVTLFPKSKTTSNGNESLHFQQDPATDWHYADKVAGQLTPGQATLIDFSMLDKGAKAVYGHLHLQDLNGSGPWTIETRPHGLNPFPPNQGWEITAQAPDTPELSLQLSARCNLSKFEIRVTRATSSPINYGYAPIWWWSESTR